MKFFFISISLLISIAFSKDLTPTNFSKTINQDSVVVVKFWAPWCAPCNVLKPEFKKATKIVGNRALMASYNVDIRSNILNKYSINMIPTIILFKNGKEKDRKVATILSADSIAKWVLSYTK